MQLPVTPTDLADAQWHFLEPFLPLSRKMRRPRTDVRAVVNGLLYLTKGGIPWRLLLKEFPPWRTVSACPEDNPCRTRVAGNDAAFRFLSTSRWRANTCALRAIAQFPEESIAGGTLRHFAPLVMERRKNPPQPKLITQ